MTNMKKLAFLLMIFTACTQTGSKYSALDMLVENYDNIENILQYRSDSLRSLYLSSPTSLKWEYANQLYELYRNRQLDSSITYSKAMLSTAANNKSRLLRSQAAHARNLIRDERIEDAEQLIERMVLSQDSSTEDIHAYFSAKDVYLSKLLNYDKSKGIALLDLSNQYQSIAGECEDVILIRARGMMYLGYPDKALSLISSYFNGKEIPPSYYTTMSLLYDDLDDHTKHEEYLIKSSCNCLETGSKDYYCLFVLSNHLFEIGDYARASSYMNRTIQDALTYNYPAGLKRSSRASLMMNSSLLRLYRSKSFLLYLLYTIIILLIVIFSIIISYMRKLLKAKRLANSRYDSALVRLNKVSVIKDNMLGEFMELSSKYIYKIDAIKNEYRKVLNRDGVEGLKALLHEPSFADKEFLNFYKVFDKSFLNVFPSFVDTVNELMIDSHKFSLSPTQELDTSLRILALLRLGIDDSTRISEILHISKGTVYSYRYSMRRESKDSERFEERIKTI